MSLGELVAAVDIGNAKFKPLVSVRSYLGLGAYTDIKQTQQVQAHTAALLLTPSPLCQYSHMLSDIQSDTVQNIKGRQC